MDILLRKLALTTVIAAVVVSTGSARADDTDVYMNPGAGLPAGSEPMVMFSLDYRPNLGSRGCKEGECDTLIAEGYMSATGPYTFFDVLRGALRKVFDPLEGVKVGLMLNHDNQDLCAGFGRPGCSNGGSSARCERRRRSSRQIAPSSSSRTASRPSSPPTRSSF